MRVAEFPIDPLNTPKQNTILVTILRYGIQSTVSNINFIAVLCPKYGLCRFNLPNYLPRCSNNNNNNAPSVRARVKSV